MSTTAQAIRNASMTPADFGTTVVRRFTSGVRFAIAALLFVPLAVVLLVVSVADPDPRRGTATESAPRSSTPIPAVQVPTIATASEIPAPSAPVAPVAVVAVVDIGTRPAPSSGSATWTPCQPWTLCSIAVDAWTVDGDRRALFGDGYEGGVLRSCNSGDLCPLTPRSNRRWCVGPDGRPYSDPGRGECR